VKRKEREKEDFTGSEMRERSRESEIKSEN
jgi:hypothetical protein